jgi:tryptophan synthase beta chain
VGRDGAPLAQPATEAGRRRRAPDGLAGIAISEAVEVARQTPTATTRSGSVLNHVLLHQTVIGQEAIAQLGRRATSPT